MKGMKCATVVFVLLMAVTCIIITFSAAAYGSNEFDVYLKGESFTWKEFDDRGDQLLKESGPVFGVGGSAKWDIKSLFIKLKGELFGGTVNYDGQTQSGLPVETDTDYLGGVIEGNLGWKFIIAESSSIEPFIGPAARYWDRRIRSSMSGMCV
jgi:hypothetical protein